MFREWDDVMARGARQQMIMSIPAALFFGGLFVVTGFRALFAHGSAAGPLVSALFLVLNVWTWVEKRGQLARYEKRRDERENAAGDARTAAARAARRSWEAAREADRHAAESGVNQGLSAPDHPADRG